jgi:hypothetical protein
LGIRLGIGLKARVGVSVNGLGGRVKVKLGFGLRVKC